MFFNIGGAEILVIAIVALIAIGPEQLPGVMRRIGGFVGQARAMTAGLREEFMSGVEELSDAVDAESWMGSGTDDDPVVPRGYATRDGDGDAETPARPPRVQSATFDPTVAEDGPRPSSAAAAGAWRSSTPSAAADAANGDAAPADGVNGDGAAQEAGNGDGSGADTSPTGDSPPAGAAAETAATGTAEATPEPSASGEDTAPADTVGDGAAAMDDEVTP